MIASTLHGISCPTPAHGEYLGQARQFCLRHALALLVKGSLASGGAQRYSDLDLLIVGPCSAGQLDEFVQAYATPVLRTISVNPPGLLLASYPDGLAADLDFRETVPRSELATTHLLTPCPEERIRDSGVARPTKLLASYLPERPAWYMVLRLFHKGMLKHLCGKAECAGGFLEEIREELGGLHLPSPASGSFCAQMAEAFACLSSQYPVDPSFSAMMKKLFAIAAGSKTPA